MTVVEAVLVPLVPFTVTVYCPVEPEQERVEFPDDVNMVTLRVQERPGMTDLSKSRSRKLLNLGNRL